MPYNPQGSHEREGRIVVYRARFLRLLNWPKPLRDQLILELPTLNGLRTHEVATAEVRHVDLEHGDLEVLDSKKYQFYTIPLDYGVGRHFQQYFTQTGITEGLVFRAGWKAGRRSEGPLSDSAIDYIWVCGA